MAQIPLEAVFAEMLADAVDHRNGEPWSEANKASATSVFNAYIRWCRRHQVTALGATRADIRAYLDARRAEGLAPSTLHVHWRMLRAFYRWATTPVVDGGGGELDADPMLRIRGPKVPKRPSTRAAKPDEVAAVIAAFGHSTLGKRNAAMVSLMWRSGLRVGELPHLDLAHYTPAKANTHPTLFVPVTKTGEPRTVPVHPETERYLARYLRKRGPLPGPLFLGSTARTNDTEGRLKTRAIQDVIWRAQTRARVRLAPHQLRRGFTAQYLRAGGDTISLEVIGGWADPRMPARYLADERDAAAIDRYFTVIATDEKPTKKRRLRAVD